MDPMTLLTVLVLMVPIVGSLAFFAPIYAGMLTSLYLIYQPEDQARNPVLDMKFKIGKVVDSYERLFDYWRLYGEALSLHDFTLPLLVPPIVGTLVGLFFLYRFYLFCQNVFRL